MIASGWIKKKLRGCVLNENEDNHPRLYFFPVQSEFPGCAVLFFPSFLYLSGRGVDVFTEGAVGRGVGATQLSCTKTLRRNKSTTKG